MSMSIHISIFYLRPYIISHNSQYGHIIGTLKNKFGLKMRWRMGRNGLRLIINFGRKWDTGMKKKKKVYMYNLLFVSF
jgi:hypothetical protein